MLAVDPTLHWANPPQGSDPACATGGRDTRPPFASTPDRYTGPVPRVTHVHGSVGDESDGYAEAGSGRPRETSRRQAITVDEDTQTFQVVPGSAPLPPAPWENGFKDTVIALPGQVTRVRAQFTMPGQFVWRCHIVEHEDNEMMRPFRIGPVQPGQPT